jgi:hypothetical protein
VSTAFNRSIALAAVLHGAVVIALARRPIPAEAPTPVTDAPLDLQIFELAATEVESAPVNVAAAVGVAERRVEGIPGATARGEARATGDVAPPTVGSAEVAVAPSPFASAAPAGSGEAERDARGRDAIAGLFAGKLSPGPMAPAAPEASTAPALPPVSKDRAGEVLRDLLDAHDREVGVGFGGPVATAAHQASLSSSAPQTGNATLEAIADGSGNVVDVHVVTGLPSPSSWASVASATLAGLRSQRLRVGGRSASVVVKVEAKMQLPSGANGKIERKGAGAEFDVADIGAVKLRVVSARVVSERRQ